MALRFNHYIKKNYGNESPENILIVDTESNIKNKDKIQYQTFRLGYAIHLKRQSNRDYLWSHSEFELHSVEDFWNLLDQFSQGKKRLYVIAHNMAYDYAILKLDTYISDRNLKLKMRVIDSVFIVKASNIMFMSSTNYYRQSLKDLGEIFKLSKMESPDFSNVSDKELMTYCRRDTEVLTKIIIEHIDFVSRNNLGCFKPTIASQAFTAFRHRFMSHNILAHNHQEILDMEKESYRGGRCEVFHMGHFDKLTCLDINSMYPHVMKTFEYPTTLVSSNIARDISIDFLKESIKTSFVMADCVVNLKEPFIACKREKLIFPIGTVRQVLASPEIEYILNNPECGEIVSVKRAVFYEKAKIFSDYVDFFYKLRQDAPNDAIKTMCKLFLNSLYGKLGQRHSSIMEQITDENIRKNYFTIMQLENTLEVYTAPHEKYIRLGDELFFIKRIDGEFSHDSVPIIASAVTAYARRILWELIKKAGRENVIYCDTDSIFVTDIGLAKLSSEISQTELGKLKVEKSGEVIINGAKDYVFNGKIKLKGIKENAEKISDTEYIQYQFHTKNARYKDGSKDGTVIVERIVKKLSRNYDKGSVCADGLVRPLVFAE